MPVSHARFRDAEAMGVLPLGLLATGSHLKPSVVAQGGQMAICPTARAQACLTLCASAENSTPAVQSDSSSVGMRALRG
ncbi:hypothetical protein BCR34DRAFT_76068 [Clohesyomyces aquaticus]|uniref:Uncharacterized protein n=1 Tax=Clohesyomyces aquaticus TaxID=1231657 RepID=A0A1Y1YYM3_9PLEO|nr:hypothetical protein BCR34DRAFT_76068 [Clohesyomyces aquaticus]